MVVASIGKLGWWFLLVVLGCIILWMGLIMGIEDIINNGLIVQIMVPF